VEPLGTALVGPGRTLVIDPYDPSLEETFLDGLEPVKVERGDRHAEDRPPNRGLTRRAAPMVGVLSVLLAGVVAAALGARGGPTAEDEAAAPVNDVIDLPAASVPLGLTDDNKETVLAACMRMSGNPNTECRHVYLRDLGEFPHREVGFPPLGVDRYEVSNAQYERCVEAGGCARRPMDECQLYTHRGYQIGAAIPERMLLDEMPAICVTRAEAAHFCEWAGGRLPTPDEWERVARAGDDRLAPWGALWTPRILNWGETDMGGFSVVGMLDGYELTAPVDRFAAGRTPDGVYNMLGNVAEWVAPWAEMPDGTRGGSYRDTLHNLRVTYQHELRPEARRSDVGFRCVYD
jgi:formylglycine-generating enzyme required for sulfatase activity